MVGALLARVVKGRGGHIVEPDAELDLMLTMTIVQSLHGLSYQRSGEALHAMS